MVLLLLRKKKRRKDCGEPLVISQANLTMDHCGAKNLVLKVKMKDLNRLALLLLRSQTTKVRGEAKLESSRTMNHFGEPLPISQQKKPNSGEAAMLARERTTMISWVRKIKSRWSSSVVCQKAKVEAGSAPLNLQLRSCPKAEEKREHRTQINGERSLKDKICLELGKFLMMR